MSSVATLDASRPDFDAVVQAIVDYVLDFNVRASREAISLTSVRAPPPHAASAKRAKTPNAVRTTAQRDPDGL